MRHALFTPDMNAGTVGARAVVRRLRMAQGVDVAQAGLGLRSRPSGPPPRMQRETQVLAALERGDVGFAADCFLGEIRRHELSTDPDDLQQYADTATGILADLFWIAIRLGRRSQAGAMIRQLLHEARRRGGLWAYVEAMYLQANLLHDHALSDRIGRGEKEPLRQKARALLREATRYAIRIPRPDFVVDAIRLSVYLEPDGDERRRLLNGLEVWGGRVAPGEKSFWRSLIWCGIRSRAVTGSCRFTHTVSCGVLRVKDRILPRAELTSRSQHATWHSLGVSIGPSHSRSAALIE